MNTSRHKIPVNELIEAWHSQQTAEVLADQFAISHRQLLNAWGELRTLHLIPRAARRLDQPRRNESDGTWDGRPRIDELCDKLLERLQHIHKRPRYDIARELMHGGIVGGARDEQSYHEHHVRSASRVE